MALTCFELAKLGKPNAIAAYLTDELQSQGVTASVERAERGLNVQLHIQDKVDRRYLIALVSQKIRELELQSMQLVNLFGYGTNSSVPLWSYRLTMGQGQPTPFVPNRVEASGQPEPSRLVDRFLVCGLGSLGQYCVYSLRRFATDESDVSITAITQDGSDHWDVENFLDLLAEPPWLGDCRDDAMLLKAGVQHCRAILLATSNETVNIETAIAARRLNPNIRLVVRSSRQNLNQLLKQQLGNFTAYEPTEMPALAFALAGLQVGILGAFDIGEARLQVVEQQVELGDRRFDGNPALTLHRKDCRLVSYSPAEASPDTAIANRVFYQWHPDTQLKPGDTIAYIELAGQTAMAKDGAIRAPRRQATAPIHPLQQLGQAMSRALQVNLAQQIGHLWQWIQAQQNRQIISLGVAIAVLLWAGGAMLLKQSVADMTWQHAISAGAILLMGGYGDLFGGLENAGVTIPWTVQFACLLITLVSLLFVLGALGLVADSLISSRFDFLRKRPAVPAQDHVVLVGLGRVGQRIATLLHEFKQPMVAIAETLENVTLPAQVPLLLGDSIKALANANLAFAKSMIVVTDDQMLNLEVALMARDAARQQNRDIRLVVRSYDQRFGDNLANLLPDARILAAYALSAEVFAAAAFGENILSLFRLNGQTILVPDFVVVEGDTLNGKLLSQVAYGYSVVPIFHQRATQQRMMADGLDSFMPPDDRMLQPGDRLILLASINGLRRIERGDITPPRQWQLTAQTPLNTSFLHDLGSDLARISGCSLDDARAFMNTLPGTIHLSLYDYQAHRLQQELGKQLRITLQPL